MSTVVLTPTHIACDHMVVEQTLPNRSRIDTDHMKIFIEPGKTFLYALAGSFSPAVMTSDSMVTFMQTLFQAVSIERRKDISKFYSLVEDKTLIEAFTKTFSDDTELFLVSSRQRYTVMYLKKKECLAIQTIDDFYGIGTGGAYAVGLLHGGMSLDDIWGPLNEMADTSSVAHTIIDLDCLEEELVP